MEGLGKKIILKKQLKEDMIPAHSGFVSSQSETETMTETEDSSFNHPEATHTDSCTTPSSGRTGIVQIEYEFTEIRQNIVQALNKTKEEQTSLVYEFITRLHEIPVFNKLLDYYNLNNHLIDASHFFKMILDIGEFPTEDSTQKWIYILSGIVMEKQLAKDNEISLLEDLCRETCADVQKLSLTSRDSFTQFNTYLSEAKQIQMANHDILIQLQEIINDKTVPELKESKLTDTESVVNREQSGCRTVLNSKA